MLNKTRKIIIGCGNKEKKTILFDPQSLNTYPFSPIESPEFHRKKWSKNSRRAQCSYTHFRKNKNRTKKRSNQKKTLPLLRIRRRVARPIQTFLRGCLNLSQHGILIPGTPAERGQSQRSLAPCFGPLLLRGSGGRGRGEEKQRREGGGKAKPFSLPQKQTTDEKKQRTRTHQGGNRIRDCISRNLRTEGVNENLLKLAKDRNEKDCCSQEDTFSIYGCRSTDVEATILVLLPLLFSLSLPWRSSWCRHRERESKRGQAVSVHPSLSSTRSWLGWPPRVDRRGFGVVVALVATSRFRRGTLTVDPPGSPHVCGQRGAGGRTMGSLKGGRRGSLCPVPWSCTQQIDRHFAWRNFDGVNIKFTWIIVSFYCFVTPTHPNLLLYAIVFYTWVVLDQDVLKNIIGVVRVTSVFILLAWYLSSNLRHLGYFFTVTTLGFPRYMCDNGLPYLM